MKPLTLTIQAFESYKDKTEINFVPFDNSLFLIDGVTGAGKTTIFDAISFALFGDPSGDIRDVKNFRSGYALKDVPTEVTLRFSVHNNEYVITRRPPQYYPSKRNKTDSNGETNFTFKNEEVTFSGYGISRPLTKKSEVNEAITSLLVLKKEQFDQTMMIAQNRFDKLIQADTNERRTIFQEILGTQKFADFELALKDKAASLNEEVVNINSRIDEILSSYPTEDSDIKKYLITTTDMTPHSALDISLPLLNNDVDKETKELLVKEDEQKKAEEAFKIASSLFDKAKTNNEHIDEYLKAKEGYLPLLNSKSQYEEQKKANDRYDKAILVLSYDEVRNKALNEKEKATKALSILLSQKPLLLKEEEEAKKNNEHLTSLNEEKSKDIKEKTTLENKSASFTKRDEAQKEVNASNVLINELAKKIKDKTDEEDRNKKDIASLRALHNSSTLQSQISSKEAEVKETKKNEESLNNLRRIKNSIDEYLKNAPSLKSYNAKDKEYQIAFSTSQELERAYLANQAGIMAKDLKEGTPCPVCGSPSHPHLHRLEDNISEDDVNKAKKEAEIKRDELSQESTRRKVYLATGETKQESFVSSLHELINKEVPSYLDSEHLLNEEMTSLLAKGKQIEGELEKLKKDYSQELTDLDKANKLEKENEEVIAPLLNSLTSELTNDKEKKAKAESALSLFSSELGTLTIEKLNEDISTYKQKIDDIDKEITSINKAYTQVESSLLGLEKDIESNNKIIKENDGTIKNESDLIASSLLTYKFTSLNEAKSYLSRSNEEVEVSKEAVDTFFNTLSSSKGLYEQCLNNGYDKLEKQDEEILLTKKNEADTKKTNAIALTTSLSCSLKNKKGIIQRIEDITAEGGEKRKLAERVTRLSKISNGTMSQSERLDFETYYQSQVFNEIITIASEKLSRMSGGQFTMYPHKRLDDDPKSCTALDIDIFDTSTGKKRPISTLSGGESFKASLSLALSFSEAIRTQSGAAELDCMFIDEGFGTLDDESLAQVIAVLKHLSSDSNRMVGIISHVDALADNISKKIMVTKDENGSHIKEQID